MGQSIQEWTNKISGRQSLKNMKSYGLLKAFSSTRFWYLMG